MMENNLAVRVTHKLIEAQGICSLELRTLDGGPLPGFSAGSHIDLYLPNNIVRQYSLCNSPRETHRYLIAVLRDSASRGGSRAVHDTVQPGDVLTVGQPRNHFSLNEEAKSSLLFAGGIGVTPILCMAERLVEFGAEFHVHYAARSSKSAAFIERIKRSSFDERVSLHFDDELADQRLNIEAVLSTAHTDTHLYVCGPKGFMDAVLDTARRLDWPESQLHWEFFSRKPRTSSTGDDPFELLLSRSGKLITVPSDKTAVEALADAGVVVPVSCEQGVCGTCLTRVLEGELDHRDMYLTDEEHMRGDQFTPCCSRAKSPRLVLDL